MTQSNFSIQGRPTEYLFFETSADSLLQVASTGLATESKTDDREFMRSASVSELMDNVQFVAALSTARGYAAQAGLELYDDMVYFD